jgi:hypothetical protein
LSAADAVALEPTQLTNAGSRLVSGRVTIVANGGLQLEGTLSSLQINNSFTVVSASPNNAFNAASREALKVSYKTQFQALAQAEVQAALGAPSDKPLCGLVMVRGQRSMAMDNVTFIQATYDKPIVQMISPKLSPERIKLQLQNPIKITGITATLQTNDEAIMATGLVKKGEVELSLIPSERTLSDSLGNPLTIKAEAAYRITSKFVEPNGAGAGLPSVLDQIAEFYVSGQKISHVILKSPRPEMPLIVYSRN